MNSDVNSDMNSNHGIFCEKMCLVELFKLNCSYSLFSSRELIFVKWIEKLENDLS